MIATSEIRALPLADRLQLVEQLWDSIVEDQAELPDPPTVVAELRERRARFAANPSSGIRWNEARKRIRSARA